VKITLDVPDQYFGDEEPGEIGKRIKLYAALFMFQSGELSAEAAVELAGVKRYKFLSECGRRGISPPDFSEEGPVEVEAPSA
jgi:predicted HTH domain antitoxin